jgi:hypothetical protein
MDDIWLVDDVWPKFVECIQGTSFGVKYYRYNDATSDGIPFDIHNKEVAISDNYLTAILQKGKPFELPEPRCLWKVRFDEPRYEASKTPKRPRQRNMNVPRPVRLIMLD